MSNEKQRELFEAWNGPHFLTRNNTPGSDLSGYQYRYTQGRWDAWQAAIAAQPKPAPVLLTDDEIHAFYAFCASDEELRDASAIEAAVLRKHGIGGG